MAKIKYLMCKAGLEREIKATTIHHSSCPWNYYLECKVCGYQNNLSKLLGFWSGCSSHCRERWLRFQIREVISVGSSYAVGEA